MKITSEAHRTCPVCETVVRPNQVRVRPHRAALLLYALIIPAGALGFWLAYRWGWFGLDDWRNPEWIAVLAMAPFFLGAWFLPKIRVVRCPTCQGEHRVRHESRRR